MTTDFCPPRLIFVQNFKNMRTFDGWSAEELELTFGLREVRNHPLLQNWLSTQLQSTAEEQHILLHFQHRLETSADSWNEDEMKFFFIGPVVALVDLEGENFKPFTQRFLIAKPIDIEGNEVEIGGKPDLMVATGKENPRQPFFFLHEYKPEKRRETDPKGQLLAAMFAAQLKNQADFPLFGCYVVGRLWFFMILDGNEWSRSRAFDASLPSLFEIFSILKQAKQIIAAQAKLLPANPFPVRPPAKKAVSKKAK